MKYPLYTLEKYYWTTTKQSIIGIVAFSSDDSTFENNVSPQNTNI